MEQAGPPPARGADVFTPAGPGPFLALGGERRAFAASLATEARQLGAVLGVAVTGAVVTAVCAAATAVVWWRMPGAPGPT